MKTGNVLELGGPKRLPDAPDGVSHPKYVVNSCWTAD